MNQIKPAGELSRELNLDSFGDKQAQGDTEVRTLRDLELALASGGDGLVCW